MYLRCGTGYSIPLIICAPAVVSPLTIIHPASNQTLVKIMLRVERNLVQKSIQVNIKEKTNIPTPQQRMHNRPCDSFASWCHCSVG